MSGRTEIPERAGDACRRSVLALAGALALALAGCSGEVAEAPTAPTSTPAPPGVLVGTSWLAEHAGNPGLVIIDARAREEYESEHIPGAVSLTPEELASDRPGGARDLAPLSRIEQALGAIGIDAGVAVVVYDGSNYRAAARVFWVLEVHGHPSVAVLDGGIGRWKSEGRTTTAEPTRSEPRRFLANLRPERLATMLAVSRSIDRQDVEILDSRSTPEYEGAVSKAMRSGHIPSAVHVDFERNLLEEDGGVCSFRSLDELTELYRSAIGPGKRVITYCNTGNRASVSYLALRALDYDVAVYDGSWSEWGNDPSVPIESGSSTSATSAEPGP